MIDDKQYLTQDEVNALPTGTRISVKWSGGNGPRTYRIIQTGHGPYVEDSYLKEPLWNGGKLDFIGDKQPRTMVSVI